MFQVPIFITTFNRLECLRDTLRWLEKAGQEEIYLIDNGSTYPPLVKYLNKTSHYVLYSRQNFGNKAPWKGEYIEQYAGDRHFVVTDPDIVPTEECPLDVFDYFKWALDKYDKASKLSFSLVLDDLPDHYIFKDRAIKLQGFWQTEEKRVAKNFFDARTDALMALHRPNSRQTKDAWRADSPYMARHLTWYEDSGNPNEELIYYRKHWHSRYVNWSKEIFPPALQKRVDNPNWKGE